jgi:glycosyltransferase involved in cell wall biosynthesis
MDHCWSTLRQSGEFDFQILSNANIKTEANTPFRKDNFQTQAIAVADDKGVDFEKLKTNIDAFNPDVVVVSGWNTPEYVKLVKSSTGRDRKFILAMDNPWTGSWKQRLARFVMKSYFRHFDAVMVPGERGFLLAKNLGFKESQIVKGLYGINYRFCASSDDQRRHEQTAWPKRFLSVGRLVENKGVSTLVEGYRLYREMVASPWPLRVVGTGPLASLVTDCPGIEFRGFVQPADMQREWAESGAYVISSSYDPWPLALVEACAAGLPIIHTHACGSSVELVRNGYNGIGIGANDPYQMARALSQIHHAYDRLPTMGARSRQMANAYDGPSWVQKWIEMLERLDCQSTVSENLAS